jgi:two-component system, chemotaxis family, response regulator Rcp1
MYLLDSCLPVITVSQQGHKNVVRSSIAKNIMLADPTGTWYLVQHVKVRRLIYAVTASQKQPMQRSIVLSVEDDESMAYILAEAFAEVDASIRVIRVSDGEEALAFLNRSAPFQSAPKPDLILLNLELPRRSGIEVLAAIQSNESLRFIPTVIFSSSSLEANRARCLAMGAKDYIKKPATYEGIVEAVRLACACA